MPCGPMMVRSVVPASCTEPSDVRAAANRFSFVSRSTYTWMASKPRFDLRQPADCIRRPVHARLLRQRQRHQQARRQLLAVLVALARVARQHVSARRRQPCRASRSVAAPPPACGRGRSARRLRCRAARRGCASAAPRRLGPACGLCSSNSSPRLACMPGGGDCSQRWYSSSAAAAGARCTHQRLGRCRSLVPPARAPRCCAVVCRGGRPGALPLRPLPPAPSPRSSPL